MKQPDHGWQEEAEFLRNAIQSELACETPWNLAHRALSWEQEAKDEKDRADRAEAALREAMPLLHEASKYLDLDGAQVLASCLHRAHEKFATLTSPTER